LIMLATARSLKRVDRMRRCRSTARKAGPASTPEAAIQARHARTGQVAGCDPYGKPRISPSASWSVFDRRIVRTRPSALSWTSSTSRPTISLRRNAPAKPVNWPVWRHQPPTLRRADGSTQRGSTNFSGVGPVHAAGFCGRVTAMWLRIRRW
jgi:hypothetical protein